MISVVTRINIFSQNVNLLSCKLVYVWSEQGIDSDLDSPSYSKTLRQVSLFYSKSTTAMMSALLGQ